jgi:outer membrane protein assembly factor BamB
MRWNLKKILWGVLLVPFVLAGVWLYRLHRGIDENLGNRPPKPLRIAVADPICEQLAPDSLKGRGSHDYFPLGTFLTERLHRPIEISSQLILGKVLQSPDVPVDLIIATASAVTSAAAQANRPVRPLARLTDSQGNTEIWGVFVVRAMSPAQTLGDLADHRILFGPPYHVERHADALAALAENGVAPVPPLQIVGDCGDALAAVVKSDADVAVISSYALPLLENSPGVGTGTLRVVGRTAKQPFIGVFATDRLDEASQRAIRNALLSLADDPNLLAALSSKSGFVDWEQSPAAEAPAPAQVPASAWTDWRGPGRNGVSPDVPDKLPERLQLVWKRRLTGQGLSGVSATATHVIVADKSEQNDQDVWRCLDAETGKELWTIAYPTPREMKFMNVPRATPVIHGGFAYLLGAFGDLHCVSIEGRRIVWRRNVVKDFNAQLPPWGMCSTPLIVDDMLIVNPGAPNASLVALGLYTGETVWQTPGEGPGYGSLIVGTFGGVRQIVGHDATSLGGWDPNTGKRLWTLLPTKKGDYNVPTPIDIDGRLLVATENNGARLYDFGASGRINPIPVAQNRRFAPDTSTPVVVGSLVFGCFRGLHCLDLNDGLNTLYSTDGDRAFNDYAALVAGHGCVLAFPMTGEVILFKAVRNAFTPLSRLRLFTDAEVWSHPALIGNRLYIRSMKEICCFLIDNP